MCLKFYKNIYAIMLIFISPKLLANYAERFEYREGAGFAPRDIYKKDIICNAEKFRRNQIQSLVIVVILFITGFILKYYVSDFNLSANYSSIKILSLGFIAHSLFGKCGWNIQTMEGNSIVERVNNLWFKLVYSVGLVGVIYSSFS